MSSIKFPIGIQDFASLISDGYIYIDKTKLIYQLITEGKYYFLARPRRFGKSLLISTLKALFLGKRELFKNLWIDNTCFDWMEYPVIHLDMGTIDSRSPKHFDEDLKRTLKNIATQYDLNLDGNSAANYLQDLISKLATTRQVVILVDEYDKPILDNIEDLEAVQTIRRELQRFYTIFKSQDENIKFALFTGVTKFSKVSVFSGLNNLNDITMTDTFSGILGYTSEELRTYFSAPIAEVTTINNLTIEECYIRIKEWYNGYKFSPYGDLVYNPFSTLKLLSAKKFESFWFETGTPTFLINVIKNRHFDIANLDEIIVSALSFGIFDIEKLPSLPLLYQTGYLTIKSYDPEIRAYHLGFPNREVSESFSESLLMNFATSESDCNKYLFDSY